jgi:DNA-binding PadR family transcriptional regulator
VASLSPLGEFEAVVLMAALHLGPRAYGSAILDEIERRTRRPVSRGAVYVTLDRLERKGLLRSTLQDGPPERGGRPHRLVRVTSRGRRALRDALQVVARMQAGLDALLGEG